jgi:hypothetical protein
MLSNAVLVRLTPAADAAIAAVAAANGLSRAAWLRGLAVAAAPLARAEARPSAPVLPPRLPREDVAAVARLVGITGKITGATVQLCKQLRESGPAGLHAEAEAVVAALRAVAGDLRRTADRLAAAVAREPTR